MATPDSHDIYESLGVTGETQPDDGPCEHESTRINLATCTVDCKDCGDVLMSLNVLVAPELRVRQ